MPKIPTEDLHVMLEGIDPALYTPKGQYHPSSRTSKLNGIFRRAYVEFNNVEGYRPLYRCAEDDVVGVEHGAFIRIEPNGNYQDYKVVGIEPDGIGLTTLILEKQ